MNKKIISVLMAAILIVVAVISSCAYTPDQLRAAEALNELELFLGTDKGYELDKSLTRAEGVTLLVRILGKETEAKNGKFTTPFTDVPDWAKGYVGYAYKNSITNGMSATEFGSNVAMTDYMFLTLTLRALGYSDKGANAKFSWDDPYELAESVGLIPTEKADKDFVRGDAVTIVWNAMDAKLSGKSMKLCDKLIEAGVFTKAEYETAKDVYKNGRQESESASGTGTSAADTSTTPPVTSATPPAGTSYTPPVSSYTPPVSSAPPVTSTTPPDTTTAPPDTTTIDSSEWENLPPNQTPIF